MYIYIYMYTYYTFIHIHLMTYTYIRIYINNVKYLLPALHLRILHGVLLTCETILDDSLASEIRHQLHGTS